MTADKPLVMLGLERERDRKLLHEMVPNYIDRHRKTERPNIKSNVALERQIDKVYPAPAENLIVNFKFRFPNFVKIFFVQTLFKNFRAEVGSNKSSNLIPRKNDF